MAKISVTRIDPTTFEVTVRDRSTTAHTVTVAEAYAKDLTGGSSDTETLIERSFDFLLEREPNTMILSSFELPVINRYFPEYEKEIRSRFG